MGSLILCNKTKADKPYYVEEFQLYIYSIEELCFYLCNNIYVINNSLLSLQLCNWIENDLDMVILAKKLYKCVKNNSLILFVITILKNTGFCDDFEIDNIKHILLSFKNKTVEERIEEKANNLLRSGKYELAITEYKNILKNFNYHIRTKFYSKLYHNLGVAYARCFLFKQAAICYKKAYYLDKDEESIKQYLFACYMSLSSMEVQKIITDEPYYKSIYEKVLKEYNNKECQYRFYYEQSHCYNISLKKQIEECKENYRHSLN